MQRTRVQTQNMKNTIQTIGWLSIGIGLASYLFFTPTGNVIGILINQTLLILGAICLLTGLFSFKPTLRKPCDHRYKQDKDIGYLMTCVKCGHTYQREAKRWQ